MYKCLECGKEIKKLYPGHTCQGCYNYFRKGGTINRLPALGEVVRDNRGYVVCHICGRAYKRLGSHIKESHDMTIAEYKEVFGLCNNTRTTEYTYSQHMRDLAYQYDMPVKLQIAGFNTRIKAGDKHLRLGKQSRLQECIEKSRRHKEAHGKY